MIPSPIVTFKRHLETIDALMGLVGLDGVGIGPLPNSIKDQMPRQFLQLEAGGTFVSDEETPYWKMRIQANAYGKTAWNAHEITLVLMEELAGTETVIVEAADHPQEVRARITDIQHAAGPIPLVLDELQNVRLETTFWAVGAIRASV